MQLHLIYMLYTNTLLFNENLFFKLSSKMALSKNTSSLTRHEDHQFVMVAVIDFGTTFSGYAFSFKSTKTDIRMNKNWGGGTRHLSFKVRSFQYFYLARLNL